MTNNFYTLSKVAEFLNDRISGKVVVECFTQEKGKLVIILTGNDEYNAVEFSAMRELPYLILRKNFSKAGKNTAPLLEEICNKEIVSVSVINDDRAVGLSLSEGYSLCFSFFATPNCFTVKDDVIISAFKDSKAFEGMKLSKIFERKSAGMKQEEPLNISNFLKLKYPHLGDIYRREIIHRMSLTYDSLLDESAIQSANIITESFLNEIGCNKYFLFETTDEMTMSLAELKHLGESSARIFEDVNSLVSFYAFGAHRKKKETTLRSSKLTSLNKSLKEAERKRTSIETQLEQCANSRFFQNCGELILANIGNIERGQLSLQTLDESGNILKIKLKPELTAPQNAALYFEKGKKQKASVQLLTQKLDRIDIEIGRIKSDISNFESSENIKELEKEFRKNKKMEKDETQRFRKFKVDGDYEVWVGKDSAANDLLTTRYSAQNDLWFHTRGSSGSHTVLKVTNKKEQVPKEAILSAAAIAAYYSKSRNAGNVPVAYCEKKYVKKKKGFKEGTVVMEKEKVVFVKPALPKEV